MGHTACTEPQCLYSTAIPLYSPYVPYGLYRTSVPVQYSYTSTPPMGRTARTEPQCLYSTAIPLLPLWAVRPVQSLSTCTVQLYLYSLYGPYGLYRASVPVQYSYTSTPPMGRTPCTEPQCLYKCALHPMYNCTFIIIIIVIIVIIGVPGWCGRYNNNSNNNIFNCKWTVTRWQWLLCTYINMK